MKFKLFRVGVLLTASIGLVAGESLWGQTYPSKPVRLIVQGLPGTAPDLIARRIAPRLSESLRQQVIVDNRAGGGGIVSAQIAAASPAVRLRSSSPIRQGSDAGPAWRRCSSDNRSLPC